MFYLLLINGKSEQLLMMPKPINHLMSIATDTAIETFLYENVVVRVRDAFRLRFISVSRDKVVQVSE